MNSPLKCVSTGETLKESKGRKENLTRSNRFTPKKQAQISEVPRQTQNEIRLCLKTEWHPAFLACYYWIPAAKWKTQTALETLEVYSILIIPVQTSAVSVELHGRKNRKCHLIVSVLLVLHLCCVSWRVFVSREQIWSTEIRVCSSGTRRVQRRSGCELPCCGLGTTCSRWSRSQAQADSGSPASLQPRFTFSMKS